MIYLNAAADCRRDIVVAVFEADVGDETLAITYLLPEMTP